MLIRIATRNDEEEIRACAEEAYRQYVAAIGKKPAPMVASFGSQIASGHVHVIANGDNEIDAFIVFFIKDEYMFLENIAVRPASQGKGLGRALIDFCESEAQNACLRGVRLYTNAKMTRNLLMYRKLGYRETGRRQEDGFDRVYFEKVILPPG